MAKSSDWLGSSRTSQLIMAGRWADVFTRDATGADGKTVQLWEKIGMPRSLLDDFMEAYTDAKTALDTAINTSGRTDVSDHRVDVTFKRLKELMRLIKRMYLVMPRVTESEYRDFGLKPRDTAITVATDEPTAQAQIRFYYLGQHQIGAIIEFVSGDEDDPANKLFHVYYMVLEPGEEMPLEPSTKWEEFSTKRKRNKVEFAYTASGKRVVFAVRIENGRKKGPFGPMSTIIIP